MWAMNVYVVAYVKEVISFTIVYTVDMLILRILACDYDLDNLSLM